MKTLIYSFVIVLLSLNVSAEIYKWVDAEGNVVYSDTPNSQAQEFKPPSMNAISMPKPKPEPETRKPEVEKEPGYKRFRIVSPTPEQVIWDNTGTLTVTFKTEPKLQPGHYFSILVDGYVMVKKTTDTTVSIADINRGEHKINALIRDQKGRTIARSNSVTVHMKRHARTSGANPQIGPFDRNGKSIRPGPVGTYFKPGPVPTITNTSQ